MPHFARMLRLTQMATSFIVLAWVKILFSYLDSISFDICW